MAEAPGPLPGQAQENRSPGVESPGHPMRDGSDDDLMRRAGSGDRDAFARLMARHLPRAVALASRVSGSRSDAEEIVQVAFCRAWLKAPELREESASGGARFSTCFTRVLVNLCIDRRRKAPLAPLEP